MTGASQPAGSNNRAIIEITDLLSVDKNDKTDYTTSEMEDELLSSSQETIGGCSDNAGGTSISEQPSKTGSACGTSGTPVLRPAINPIKPSGSKAIGILRIVKKDHKIAKNEEAGTPHENDAAVIRSNMGRLLRSTTRSREEANPPQKKSKTNGTNKQAPSQGAAQLRTLSEIVRDDLQVAVVDELSTDSRALMSVWNSIEAKLSGMVFLYTLSATEGPYPSFDSGEMIRAYRVIKCEDRFSKDFLNKSVAEVSNKWDGSSLSQLRRFQDNHWLAFGCPHEHRAKRTGADPQSLRLKNSASYLLRICEVSRGALEKADFKLSFGIKNAKIKILQSQETDPNLVEDIVEDDDVSKRQGSPARSW
ncbi:uncharacterized protein LOC129907773 [Episyrphus balteatus]|uniref:uncharacterized protein LOC129907773 n=1 Tax=Episyrphus balteatus TaxID=286459 RepID=UPI00248530B1|nr:uncharacterized protein LOC129907773 [Episyrphus balteatus]